MTTLITDLSRFGILISVAMLSVIALAVSIVVMLAMALVILPIAPFALPILIVAMVGYALHQMLYPPSPVQSHEDNDNYPLYVIYDQEGTATIHEGIPVIELPINQYTTAQESLTIDGYCLLSMVPAYTTITCQDIDDAIAEGSISPMDSEDETPAIDDDNMKEQNWVDFIMSIPCSTGLSDRIIPIDDIIATLASVTYDEMDTPTIDDDTPSTLRLSCNLDHYSHEALVSLAKELKVRGANTRWTDATLIRKITETTTLSQVA